MTRFIVIKSKMTGGTEVMSYRNDEEYFEIMDNLVTDMDEIIYTDNVSKYMKYMK